MWRQLDVVMEKNWAHSVDQCQLQALQFSASIALLSLLLKFNAFAGIQKALVDQTGSRAPNSNHDLFWWKFGFGKHFGASSRCHLLAGCCQLCKIHFLSYVTIQLRDDSLLLYRIREDDTSKWFYFFIFSQLTRHPLIEPFHLSNLLQMPNDRRMVNSEFLSNFSYSCKTVRFNDGSQYRCQPPMAGHCPSHLQGSCLLCRTSWTITTLYIC